MKRFLLGILTLVVTVASTDAYLGDNEAKISAAYGKLIQKLPRSVGTTSNLYEKGDYTYMVVFRGGVSVFEMYARADQADLSPKEIATFLKANAAGAAWVAVGRGPRVEAKRSQGQSELFPIGWPPDADGDGSDGWAESSKSQAPSSIEAPSTKFWQQGREDGRLMIEDG